MIIVFLTSLMITLNWLSTISRRGWRLDFGELFGETSVRRKFRSADFPFGKNYARRKFSSANLPSAKSTLTKIPSARIPSAPYDTYLR